MLPHTEHALQLLKDRQRQEMAQAIPMASDLDDDEFVHGDPGGSFQLHLKRKRNAGILRKMMIDAGYDDLARMANVRQERSDNEFG